MLKRSPNDTGIVKLASLLSLDQPTDMRSESLEIAFHSVLPLKTMVLRPWDCFQHHCRGPNETKVA